MPDPADLDPELPSDDPMEDLVAGALEALDRGGDDGLVAFLALHPEERTRIEGLVRPFRATGMLARDATGLPERLGEFRLLRRLGSGGMGVVFLAEQESLRRTVALKVIRPDLLFFEGSRQRFRREIEVVARLSHPAIVPVVATGEHDGMPWYAMQLVEGCSADEAVRRLQGRDPARLTGVDLARAVRGDGEIAIAPDESAFLGAYWEACVRLCRQAALGLAHAHAQGIVHRDVKPSNVMLTPDGRALVLDFGLALVQGDPRLTRGSAEPGSPAYMAPEQVRGVGADERSDVYSLAATLDQLLELRAPFAATDAEQLRTQIVQGSAEAPRNGAVPRELRLVLAAAMDVDPARRYASMAAFADDLAAVLLRRPIAARPLPLRTRMARWAERHRTAAALLAAALVMAAVVPAALAWQRGEALVVLREQKARVERSRDATLKAVREFLVGFANSDLELAPGGRALANRLLREAQAILDGLGEADTPQMRDARTFVERWVVDGLVAIGRHAEAKQLGEAILARWPASAPRQPAIASLLIGVRSSLVRVHVAAGELAIAERLLDEAERELPHLRGLAESADSIADSTVLLLGHRGMIARQQGDLPRAARLLQQALAAARPARLPDDDVRYRICQTRNRLGEVLFRMRDYDAAVPWFEATIADMATPGDLAMHPPTNLPLWSYAEWGLAMVDAGRQRWPDAAKHYQRAIELGTLCAACYTENLHLRGVLAAMLTEYGQVEGLLAGDPQAGRPSLERARKLFDSMLDGSPLTHDERVNNHTNFRVLMTVVGRQRDFAALGALASQFARHAFDAQAYANAAWNMLIAAEAQAAAGHAEDAARWDREAMDALLACERAGWFPPVDLSDKPCRRLEQFAEFAGLRERHPPEQVDRRPPRSR